MLSNIHTYICIYVYIYINEKELFVKYSFVEVNHTFSPEQHSRCIHCFLTLKSISVRT